MAQNPLADFFPDTLKLSGEALAALAGVQTQVRGDTRRGPCTLCVLGSGHMNDVKQTPWRDKGTKPVPGEGRGRIMFAGHTIGENEANTNRPAIGRASQWVFRLLTEALDKELSKQLDHTPAPDERAALAQAVLDYSYVTNLTRCSYKEEAPVGPATYKKCAPKWFAAEVRYVDPVVIVFLNKASAKVVCGRDLPVGEVSEVELYGKTRHVFPLSNHPAGIDGNGPEFLEPLRGQYKSLALWLYKQGHLLVQPDAHDDRGEVEHIFVTNRKELKACVADLWNAPVLGLDTETGAKFARDAGTPLEREKGALQWQRDHHELVTTQIAALAWRTGDDGKRVATVERTYTIANGFRDRLTGDFQLPLTLRDVRQALDELMQHKPRVVGEDGSVKEVYREIALFNASFDVPVLTRHALDLANLGDPVLGGRRYPVVVIDAQLIEARTYEHYGKAQHLNLNALCLRHIQEAKGRFDDHFTPKDFPMTDLSVPQERAKAVEYCGEDPRKTVLVTDVVKRKLKRHGREVERVTNGNRSALPPIGMAPFPVVNPIWALDRTARAFRLQEVAIPIDHQLIPILQQMTQVGFKVETKDWREINSWVERTQRQIKKVIADLGYVGYRPSATADILKAMKAALRDVAANVSKAVSVYAAEHGTDKTQDAFAPAFAALEIGDVVVSADPNRPAVTEQMLVGAFQRKYGKLDSKQATVEEKFMVFIEGFLNYLNERLRFVSEELLDGEKIFDVEPLDRLFKATFVYNKITKKKSAYFDRFERLLDVHGILYPDFNQFEVTSGRLAGNFQNVPRGAAEEFDFAETLLQALGIEIPDDPKERVALLTEYSRLDVRQYIYAVQAPDLNRMFKRFYSYRYQKHPEVPEEKWYKPWRVREDDEYVYVGADYAAQEDRMAFAQTNDPTKALLLSGTDPAGRAVDTHFYNVAFCFGTSYDVPEGIDWQALDPDGLPHVPENYPMPAVGQTFDTSTTDGTMQAYLFFTHPAYIKKFKKELRTPMKNVHYASQYGVGMAKVHLMLAPKFAKMGLPWSEKDTEELIVRYKQLYSAVEGARKAIIEQIDRYPVVEYPLFGTLRHAKSTMKTDGSHEVVEGEHLSVANAYNQGCSAYLTKYAMIRLRTLIYANARRWNLVEIGGDTFVSINLQVHDEIGCVCPKRIAHEVAKVIESAMKISVGPPDSRRPGAYYGDALQDDRQETGWLHLTDPGFKGTVLFDAAVDGPARTVAKLAFAKDDDGNKVAETLPDGGPNMYTWEEVLAEFPDAASQGINEAYPLVTGRLGGFDPAVFEGLVPAHGEGELLV